MNDMMPDANIQGWFAIAFSEELKKNQTIHGTLANEGYSLHRAKTGMITFNGRPENLLEQNGIIYTWRHPDDAHPCWQVPALDEDDWTPFLRHQLEVRSHPQEIYENSIDLAHFSIVHNFSDIVPAYTPVFDKHNMSVAYQITRKNKNIFQRDNTVNAHFELRLHGLGCAHTHIHVPAYKMKVRMLTMTTPVISGWVDIRIAIAINTAVHPAKKIFLPFIHRLIKRNIINDFRQDIPVWENKRYYPVPLLVKGDGEIMKFRRWCKQFYTGRQT